jgi:phage-related protein
LDREQAWRIVYYLTDDAVVILDVFSKKTQTTPKTSVASCRQRMTSYQTAVKAARKRR